MLDLQICKLGIHSLTAQFTWLGYLPTHFVGKASLRGSRFVTTFTAGLLSDAVELQVLLEDPFPLSIYNAIVDVNPAIQHARVIRRGVGRTMVDFQFQRVALTTKHGMQEAHGQVILLQDANEDEAFSELTHSLPNFFCRDRVWIPTRAHVLEHPVAVVRGCTVAVANLASCHHFCHAATDNRGEFSHVVWISLKEKERPGVIVIIPG